jgi:hypothetical protein
MRTQLHTLATLFYGMALLTGCASQSRRDFTAVPPTALGVITQGEIANSHGTTAYAVVERVHPMYLTSRLDLAPTAEREVYLNGVRLGGISELRGIPANSVKEIRFVRAIDGGAFGVGRSAGAILVISKAGR